MTNLIQLKVYFKDDYDDIILEKTKIKTIPKDIACLLVKGMYFNDSDDFINQEKNESWVIEKARVNIVYNNVDGCQYEIIVKKSPLKFK